MKIHITAKQIRKRGNQVAACPHELKEVPATLRELIVMLVSDCVESYHQRLREKVDSRVLTEEKIEAGSQVGKIGFGIPFGSREANLQDALETAIRGFEDGLYRIFIGEREIEALDEPLHLREEDTVTIIRLVMLTGGYF